MATKKQPCQVCGKLVLPATLKKTGGMCMPYFKKQRETESGTVFFSYRRADARITDKIVNSVQTALPKLDFFLDVTKLESGRQWSDALFAGLNRSKAILVIVGKKWGPAFAKRKAGTDVMLREIEWALAARRAMLPVLVNRATMPPASELPWSINRLPALQAMEIRRASYDADIASLATRIPSLLGEHGDSYSNVNIDSPNRARAPDATRSETSGRWESRIGMPDGQEMLLEFTLREGTNAVVGYVTIGANGQRREFSADQYATIAKAGGVNVLSGIVLDGFVPGQGSMRVTIPILEKRGDAFVGVDEQGWNFWSRLIEPAW